MAAPRIDNLNAYQNLVINGNFDFWQRGSTTLTAVDPGTPERYMPDRFKLSIPSSTISVTLSRSTDVPTFAQSGFQSTYSFAAQCAAANTAASTDYVAIRTLIEGSDYANIASGKTARIQWWVKATLAGTYSLALQNSARNRSYVKEYTLTANTWTKVTVDFTTDVSGTWLTDNGIGLSVSWTLVAGSTYRTSTLSTWQAGDFRGSSNQVNFGSSTSNIFYLSQVMLVEGSFSSSTSMLFKRAGKNIQQELSMCQRYYYQFSDFGSGTRPIARCTWYDAGALYFNVKLPTTMRGDATLVGTAGTDIVVYTTALAAQTGFSANVTTNPTKDNVYIACSKGAHGLTDGVLATSANTTGLSAEL